jgi:hypothetical protein
MIYVMMSFPALLDDTAKVSRSSSEMSNTLNNIIHTNISMSSLQDSSTFGTSTFKISNNGTTILWDYQNFDVIATYPSLVGNQITSTLQYSTTCSGLLPGYWCIQSITNDLVHPGLLDPKETANIKVALANQSITPGGTLTMNFGTDNGIVASSSVIITT